MWLISQSGFYSIVQDAREKDVLLVRSRIRGDLQRIWDNANVQENTGTDYRFRTRLLRTRFLNGLKCEVSRIDYTNFKSEGIPDKRRLPYYSEVWSTLQDMQLAIPSHEPL